MWNTRQLQLKYQVNMHVTWITEDCRPCCLRVVEWLYVLDFHRPGKSGKVVENDRISREKSVNFLWGLGNIVHLTTNVKSKDIIEPLQYLDSWCNKDKSMSDICSITHGDGSCEDDAATVLSLNSVQLQNITFVSYRKVGNFNVSQLLSRNAGACMCVCVCVSAGYASAVDGISSGVVWTHHHVSSHHRQQDGCHTRGLTPSVLTYVLSVLVVVTALVDGWHSHVTWDDGLPTFTAFLKLRHSATAASRSLWHSSRPLPRSETECTDHTSQWVTWHTSQWRGTLTTLASEWHGTLASDVSFFLHSPLHSSLHHLFVALLFPDLLSWFQSMR